MARQENPGANGRGVRSPSSPVLREMGRPVMILIEACSPHACISHSTETGAIGAKQESVGNPAAGMIVGVERKRNLTFMLRTDPKLEKRTSMQGAAMGGKEPRVTDATSASNASDAQGASAATLRVLSASGTRSAQTGHPRMAQHFLKMKVASADAVLTPSSQFLPEPLIATFTARRRARYLTDQPTKPQNAAISKKTKLGAKCGTSRTNHPIMILSAPKPTAQIIARRNECANTPENRPPTPAISSDIAKKITIALIELAFPKRSDDPFREP